MNTQQTENATAHNPIAILRFALPSLLSLLLFLVPL
jgi:hypothetical protein